MSAAKRRPLKFSSFDDICVEVDRLVESNVETRGQFSFAAILEHLARTLDIVVGYNPAPTVSFPMRLASRLARPILLRGPMLAGFKLPAKLQSALWPSEPIEKSVAVAHFYEAVARYRNAETLPRHPFFGHMTREQHDRLQCNHCALHLSFVHPIEAASPSA